MKKNKRWLLFVLVLCVFTGWMIKKNAASSIIISSSDVTAKYTSIVEVPVNITNNTGLMGFGFEVLYDEEFLEPISVEGGSLVNSGTFDDSIGTKYDNPFRVVWADTKSMIGNGKLFTLKFTAKKSGKTAIKISSMNNDTYDGNYNKVSIDENSVNVNIVCTHSYVEKIEQAATCTAKGIKSYTCSVCGDTYEEYITPIPHTYVTTTTNPTCTKNGLKTHKCSVCGYSYSEVIAAKGHQYKSVVTVPTCTAKGYTTYTCAVCGDSYVSDYTDMTNHTVVKDEKIEPTCIKTGLSEGSHCSVCGKIIVEQKVLDKIDHDYKKETVFPTCDKRGYDVYTCSMCGDSYIDNYVNALGHTIVIDAYKAPTCIEAGFTEGSHCSVCEKIITEQQGIPKLNHVYDKEVIKPTCTKQGCTIYTCKYCGDNYIEDVMQPIGHEYIIMSVQPATEIETGLEFYQCKNCKDTYTKEIPVLETTKKDEPITETTKKDKPTTGTVIRIISSSINVEKVSLTKVKNVKGKKIKMSWQKVKGISGYEIQYAINRKFTKTLKKANVKKTAKSKVIKKLKKKKKYYFRIRAYRIVNGNKKYGLWSKVKKIKIKK